MDDYIERMNGIDNELYRLPRRNLIDRENPLERYSEDKFIDRYRLRKESVVEFDGHSIWRPNKQHDLKQRMSDTKLTPTVDCFAVLFYWFISTSLWASTASVSTQCQSNCKEYISKYCTPSSKIHNVQSRWWISKGSSERFSCHSWYTWRSWRNRLQPCSYQLSRVAIQLNCTEIGKDFFSINVQAICDEMIRFTNIVVRWPGSVHDSRIFENSRICEEFERNLPAGFLLGDAGYPCRTYLLTPLGNPNERCERGYNYAQSKTRMCIERCFGIWKRRWVCTVYV